MARLCQSAHIHGTGEQKDGTLALRQTGTICISLELVTGEADHRAGTRIAGVVPGNAPLRGWHAESRAPAH